MSTRLLDQQGPSPRGSGSQISLQQLYNYRSLPFPNLEAAYLHSNILQYTSLDSYYTCQFHYKYYRPLPCTFQPIVHPFKAQDPSILILHRNPWMLLHYISPSFTIHQATTTSHRRWHFPCLLKRGRTLSKSSL